MSPIAIATDQDLLCTRCDTRNTAVALFCVGCGTPLGASAIPAPIVPAAAQHARCRACGNANPAGASYCVTCGADLVAGVRPAAAGGMFVQHMDVGVPPNPAELPIGIRALWFLFVGLWAGQLWLLVAWLLNITIIGLPLGMWMLNRMAQVMTLRQQPSGPRAPAGPTGVPFVVRAVYFVLIGWWLSLLWMELAWLASALLIGLPLGLLMFEHTSTVATLAES
ncbi:MAG TPA: zinc ribbon domain-containing protein [Roseiflexaceae bacterium]|nr:zinc ribbon domain-containing protein [Roseiflexaceae bacterium]